MGGAKRKPKPGEGTRVEGFTYTPSAVHVSHANNFSRADPYPVPAELREHIEGDTFCFTLAEVEKRMFEFVGRLKADEEPSEDALGQVTPGTIYLTATNDAFLVDGYLRHAAWLLAEVRGLLPGTKSNVFKVDKVSQPKTDEDWHGLRRRNYAENNSRKQLSPIDRAYYVRRLTQSLSAGGSGLTREQAAHELGVSSTRQVNRYLSLLELPPDIRASLHSGKLTMSEAITKGSKSGQGNAKGPRKGISIANARKRLATLETKQLPENLTRGRVGTLLKLITGNASVLDEEVDEDLRAFVMMLGTAPPKPEKPETKPKKAAPPRQEPKTKD